jgi:hypothetical protein
MICGYVRPKKMPHHSAKTRRRPLQIIGIMPVELGELESFRFQDLVMSEKNLVGHLIVPTLILLSTTLKSSFLNGL